MVGASPPPTPLQIFEKELGMTAVPPQIAGPIRAGPGGDLGQDPAARSDGGHARRPRDGLGAAGVLRRPNWERPPTGSDGLASAASTRSRCPSSGKPSRKPDGAGTGRSRSRSELRGLTGGIIGLGTAGAIRGERPPAEWRDQRTASDLGSTPTRAPVALAASERAASVGANSSRCRSSRSPNC